MERDIYLGWSQNKNVSGHDAPGTVSPGAEAQTAQITGHKIYSTYKIGNWFEFYTEPTKRGKREIAEDDSIFRAIPTFGHEKPRRGLSREARESCGAERIPKGGRAHFVSHGHTTL